MADCWLWAFCNALKLSPFWAVALLRFLPTAEIEDNSPVRKVFCAPERFALPVKLPFAPWSNWATFCNSCIRPLATLDAVTPYVTLWPSATCTDLRSLPLVKALDTEPSDASCDSELTLTGGVESLPPP